LSINALVAKIQPDKVVRWWQDDDFCVIFASCISSEPRAAHFRPAFYIRTKATPCMVKIQSPTAENRRGKIEEERKKIPLGQKSNGLPYSIWRHDYHKMSVYPRRRNAGDTDVPVTFNSYAVRR